MPAGFQHPSSIRRQLERFALGRLIGAWRIFRIIDPRARFALQVRAMTMGPPRATVQRKDAREAAGTCEYQGYTVLGSYVENSTFQIPQYHLKYVCGRSGALPSASVAPLGAPSAPPVASTPAAGPPAPAPSAGQIDPSWL